MALQVWLPLNGNLNNQGLTNITITNNNATVDVAGKIGSCYKFNGSNSYLTFSSSISLDGDHSICCWVDLTNISGVQYFISFASGGGIRYSNTDNSFLYYAGGVVLSWSYTKVNRFVHVAFVCKSNNIILYVDGQQIGNNQSLTTRANCIEIGRRSDGYYYNGKINDFRIYDHALSPKEVKELSKGLVLHYKLDDQYCESTTNLATYSTIYSNVTYGSPFSISGWGGDTGTCTCYKTGGYNNGPYKVYHKTSTGSGGIYWKAANDIHIVAGKTYTFSVYIKSSREYTDSIYSFNINRGSDNAYITYNQAVHFTTEWKRIEKTFTATSSQAGDYGEMSIIYNDDVSDYYVYYSCFQIEEKDHATPYVNGTRTATTIYDSSGYQHNGTVNGNLILSNDTPRYTYSSSFDGSTYISGPVLQNVAQTASFWLFVPSTIPSTGIVFLDRGSLLAFGYWNSGNTMIVACTNSCKCVYSASYLTKNAWNHIVIIRPTGSSEPTLYVNGILRLNNGNSDSWGGSDSEFTIGRRTTYTAYPFTGKISDFRLYSTVLSNDDIKELYNNVAYISDSKSIGCYILEENNSNIIFLENYGIETKLWLDGLGRYTQQNCQCTLTDDGYRIYRTPNIIYDGSDSSRTMWGGFVLDNTDNRFGFVQGHTYMIQFEVKGKSSNAASDTQWNNLVGWSGGGLQANPSNIMFVNPVTNNFNSTEWKTVIYKWTISDTVYKVCTSSYSSFVAGNTYLSYKGFKFGYSYISTGSLGTDIYIRNIRMYDITDNTPIQICNSGIINTSEIVELDEMKFILGDVILTNQLIEI